MQQNLNQIKYIVGNCDILHCMDRISALRIFDDKVIDYLDLLSKNLLGNAEAKQYPDVITFAFWCRKASVINLQKPYSDVINRIGKGVTFHIAPSNVAVNFAYTLVVGLLSGNANIVRLPSKNFEQVRIICTAIQNTLNHFMSQYICLIQYDHSQEITDFLSLICNTRIIWGGDETIGTIRKSPIKARASEITFADRFSICVINSDEYIKESNRKEIAKGFYNDTYLSDQNACTSPRIVIWLGKYITEAKVYFWDELYEIVKDKYTLQPVQVVSKYTNMCLLATKISSAHYKSTKDNYIFRIEVENLSEEILEYKGNSGYFIEYNAVKLDEILPICTLQCQTLAYYGFNPKEIRELILNKRPEGIDRIVMIGHTMDFSLVWDGCDLIRSLSREISGL